MQYQKILLPKTKTFIIVVSSEKYKIACAMMKKVSVKTLLICSERETRNKKGINMRYFGEAGTNLQDLKEKCGDVLFNIRNVLPKNFQYLLC